MRKPRLASATAGRPAILAADAARARGGTRFKLFPQPPFLKAFARPVTVILSPPAGTVRPGPADARMHVVAPLGKRWPYGIVVGPYGSPFVYMPAWDGPIQAPARPDARGHFDGIALGTPQFEAAHAYGCVRWVLDVWEGCFGHAIKWHFRRHYGALEISLLPQFDVGTAGYGFLEVGSDFTHGAAQPFALNFDVIAHEVGHLIIYSLLGVPDPGTETAEYQGFHESAADVVALIAAARFEPVIDELFEVSRGNLYVLNELNRFAELSQTTQIRDASNGKRLSEFSAGWTDEHDLSLPLTGAIFDILVDVFHELLVERRLIGTALEDLADRVQRMPELEHLIQAGFDKAYAANAAGFREAFADARDLTGRYLAEAWRRLTPDHLTYADVGAALIAVDGELSGGRYRRLIDVSFRWRGIGEVRVGPWLAPATAVSHLRSSRTVLPKDRAAMPRLSYRERFLLARHGVSIEGTRRMGGRSVGALAYFQND
jgi:hypothetical protein